MKKIINSLLALLLILSVVLMGSSFSPKKGAKFTKPSQNQTYIAEFHIIDPPPLPSSVLV